MFRDGAPQPEGEAKGSEEGASHGPESTPRELGDQNEQSEDDVQVPERHLLPHPGKPTPIEIAEREASGHVQYRSWCRSCVEARDGMEQQVWWTCLMEGRRGWQGPLE